MFDNNSFDGRSFDERSWLGIIVDIVVEQLATIITYARNSRFLFLGKKQVKYTGDTVHFSEKAKRSVFSTIARKIIQ